MSLRPLSLRQRLLLAVAAALLAALLAGGVITSLGAAQLVRAEISAALTTARQEIAANLQNFPIPLTAQNATTLVAGFEGSRHVQVAALINGRIIAQSTPAPSLIVPPAWFSTLASPGLAPSEINLPGGELRITPRPESEICERWSEIRRLMFLLGLASAFSAALCFFTAAWSLHGLTALSSAFARLEQGHSAPPLAITGPREVTQLAQAFNRMQIALTRAAQDNRRLMTQLDRVAEEERAELARDLHDEAGPLLFAITAWATAARMQDQSGDQQSMRTSLASCENAAFTLQTSLRDVLHRLRDSAPGVTDLPHALQELIDFWREINPQTEFMLTMPPDADLIGESLKSVLYRVAQEGVSNAMRHANPSTLCVTLATLHNNEISLSVQDNGKESEISTQGFGLVGIEERLRAIGGRLRITRENGWCLTAIVPQDQGISS